MAEHDRHLPARLGVPDGTRAIGVANMRDHLPPIHIVAADPHSVVEKLAKIAEFGAFNVVHDRGSPTTGDITVSLRFTRPSPHRDLGVHLVARVDERRIGVEIRATEWARDSFPSYETYSAAANELLGPLLTAYNKGGGRRLRMTIVPKEKLEPKLPPWSGKLFRHFIDHANIHNLHPNDWRRFYEFVRARPALSEDDLTFLLVKEGFSERAASEISNVYSHLREFMRPRNAAELFERYALRKAFVP
jgi:hypothetical protein